MKSYVKLSFVLFGILLLTAHCKDAAGMEAADYEEDPGSEGEDVPEGDDMPEGAEGEEDEGEMPEGEEGEMSEDGEEGEEDAEGDDMDKMEALTPEQMSALHKKIDGNGNGKVSLAEVQDFAHKMRRELAKSELDEVMKDMDTDKDGKLNLAEFLSGMKTYPEEPQEEQNEKQKQFEELDTNKDKSINMDELAQMYHHHTNDLVETELTNVAMKDKDQDKNGVLSLEEFFQHLSMEGEAPADIPEEDKEIFKKLDTDGSGSLTLKELKAWESGSFQAEEAARKLFVHADKDKDNHLTAEEMTEARHDIAADKDYEPQMYLSQWAEQHAAHDGEL